jgi:CHAD domain-containing protein
VRISVALWTRRSEPLVLRALIHRRASGTLGGRRTRKRLRKRLLDLEEKLAQPDPLDADAAHSIRIAAKKLRYEAELLRGAYDLAEAIDLLTRLQSALGELHDADVRLATVRANPRLARAARAERRRSAAQARRIVLRAKRLCPRLRRERL